MLLSQVGHETLQFMKFLCPCYNLKGLSGQGFGLWLSWRFFIAIVSISVQGRRTHLLKVCVENETRALSVALDAISKIISREIFELPSQCMLIKINEFDYRDTSVDQLVQELSSHFMSNTNSDQQIDNVIRLASGFDHSTTYNISIAEQDVTLLDLIKQIQRKTGTTLKFSRTEIIFVPLP